MDTLLSSFAHRRLVRLIILTLTIILTVLFALLNQPAAAALIPLIAGLLAAIARRDARAREIAHRVITGELIEKLEVPGGAWGQLCRAVNGLLQERRTQQRLQAALPLALPDDALAALLNGSAANGGELRIVAVLAIGCGQLPPDPRARQATLTAWRAVADASRTLAQRNGALFQPFGSAVILVFGAFDEQPVEIAVQAALRAADTLESLWWNDRTTAGQPLGCSLAGGAALVTTVPGMGYCALGAPVDQAGQIQRLAPTVPRYRVLCSESVYYSLRRVTDRTWEPTGLQTFALDGRPQAVYGWTH